MDEISNEVESQTKVNGEVRFKSKLKEALSILLPKITRTRRFAICLIILHMWEFLSLTLPESTKFSPGLMPTLHTVLLLFNMRQYQGALCEFFATAALLINFCYISFFFGYTLITKNTDENRGIAERLFQGGLTNVTKIYIPFLMIPTINLSSTILFIGNFSFSLKAIGAFNLLTTLGISLLLTTWQINFSFSLKDHFAGYPSMTDYFLLIAKMLLSVIFFKENQYNTVVGIIFIIIFIADYLIRINFSDRLVSRVYLMMLLAVFTIELVYFLIIRGIYDTSGLEPGYFIMFSATICYRLAERLRILLLKVKIFDKDLFHIDDDIQLDILGRELKNHFKNAKNDILISHIEILHLVKCHKFQCRSDTCDCRIHDLNLDWDWKKNKPFVRKIIGDIFKKSLKGPGLVSRQKSILNYCAFIVDIEKLPNKALFFMFKNKESLSSFNSKVAIRILSNKSRIILEKNLKRVENFTKNFSEILVYESNQNELEILFKKFLLEMVKFNMMMYPNRHEEPDLFVRECLGKSMDLYEVRRNLRGKMLKMLELNPENIRILHICLEYSKLFEEDIEFAKIVRRLEQKRIVIMENRKKLINNMDPDSTLDIFNPNSGVIFINMTDYIGRIEKVSRNILNLFEFPYQEVMGNYIENFMPEKISIIHKNLVKDFIKSGRTNLMTRNTNFLSAKKYGNHLLNLNVMLRVDTFFPNTFMVCGLLTAIPNYDRSMLCDDSGNILHYTMELEKQLHLGELKNKKNGYYFNICVLVPQLYWVFNPEKANDFIIDFSGYNDSSMIWFSYKELDVAQSPGFKPPSQQNDENTAREKQIMNKNELSKYELKKIVFRQIIKNKMFSKLRYRIWITLKWMTFVDGTIRFLLINFLDIDAMSPDEPLTIAERKELKRFKPRKKTVTDQCQENLIENINFLHEKTHKRLQNQLNHTTHTNKSFTNSVDSKLRAFSIYSDNNMSPREQQDNIYEKQFENFVEANVRNENSVMKKISITPLKIGPANNNSAAGGSKNLGILQKVSHEITSPEKKFVLSKIEREEAEAELEDEEKSENGTRKFKKHSVKYSAKSSFDEQKEKSGDAQVKFSQSEHQSAISSNTSLKDLVISLWKTEVSEIKYIKIVRAVILLGTFGLILSSGLYNHEKAVQVHQYLESSHLLQDLTLPVNLLMKNFIIDFFKRKGLFNETLNNEQLFEYLGISVKSTWKGVRGAFAVRLRDTKNPEDLLLNNKISLEIASDSIITKQKIVSMIDLDRTYGIFLNYLWNSEDKLMTEVSFYETSSFLVGNYLNFIRNMIDLFFEIEKSVQTSLNKVQEFGLYLIIGFIPVSLFLIIYVFCASVKIKLESHKLALTLKFFKKCDLDNRIEKIGKRFISVFPKNFIDLRTILNQETVWKKIKFKSKKSAANYDRHSQSTPKILNGRKNNIIVVKKRKSSLLNIFSYSQLKTYIFILLTSLLLTFILPLGTLVINEVFLLNFQDKLNKVLLTQTNIQLFTCSIATTVSLKHIEYFSMISPDEIKKSQTEDVKNYYELLRKKIEDNSNPDIVLSEEQGYPELTNIDFAYFFSDICEVLKEKGVDIYFTERYNYDSCNSIFRGILKKGAKNFAATIMNLVQNWDYKLATSSNSTEELSQILQTPEYADFQYALKLIQLLEGSSLQDLSHLLNDYIEFFNTQVNVWLILSLTLILLVLILVWIFIVSGLQKVYFSSVSLLNNFPPRFISGNKPLFAKINRLIKS